MKLKNSIYFLLPALLLFTLWGCASLEPKEPEFITFQKVRVTKITPLKATIKGDAVFRNPNPIGLTLDNIDIDVKVNDVDVGKATQSGSVSIPGNSNFNIPVVFDFKLKQVLSDVIVGVLGAIIKQEVDVEYNGVLHVSAAEIKFEVPFEYEETIPLKEES